MLRPSYPHPVTALDVTAIAMLVTALAQAFAEDDVLEARWYLDAHNADNVHEQSPGESAAINGAFRELARNAPLPDFRVNPGSTSNSSDYLGNQSTLPISLESLNQISPEHHRNSTTRIGRNT